MLFDMHPTRLQCLASAESAFFNFHEACRNLCAPIKWDWLYIEAVLL